MAYFDYEALATAPLVRDPYDFIAVENFIRPERFAEVSADFPKVPGPGSHPPSELTIAGHFAAAMAELDGPKFRESIERKFGVDLTGRPAM